MGIIDGYYGGYESLALFMDSDGDIDYEAAYDAQIPDGDDDDDFETDPFNRAFNYKFNQELRKLEKANKRKKLPGWRDTGNRTSLGKSIYEGHCTSCQQQCTVPFAPIAGGKPPMCKPCLAAADEEEDKEFIEHFFSTFTEDIDDVPEFDEDFKAHCKKELRKDLEELCVERKQQQRSQAQRDEHKAPSSSRLVPGWTATGSTTLSGKPIYQGHCSSCNKQCTVPFAPMAAATPPMCKQCLGQSKGHAGVSTGAGTSKAAELWGGGSVLAAAGALQQHEKDVLWGTEQCHYTI